MAKQKYRWPADRVSRRSVIELAAYVRNARTHSPEQVQQIAKSIETFGFTVPVLVDEFGTIIAGHGRVMAAKLLGLDEVPVMVAEGWNEEQKRLYILADNKLTENGGWDEELLRLELEELSEDGAEIALAGFSIPELDKILGEDDPNNAAEEWQGMPQFQQDDKGAYRSLIVHFPDQAAVDDFMKLHGRELSSKAKFMWYPEESIAISSDKRYRSTKS